MEPAWRKPGGRRFPLADPISRPPPLLPQLQLIGRLRPGSRSGRPPAWLDSLKVELLREIDILRDLSAEDMEWLRETTRMVTYAGGQIIYSPDQTAETLFMLKHGHVLLYRLSAEGRKLEVGVIGAGTFFGDMPLLGQTMRHVFAEAVDDVLVCVLNRRDVERLILREPRVALRMLEVLGKRLAGSEDQQARLAFEPVPARLARALVQLADGDTVYATHRQLAETVGAYRETVTKLLDDLQRDGVVGLARGRVVVRDWDRLRALCAPSAV